MSEQTQATSASKSCFIMGKGESVLVLGSIWTSAGTSIFVLEQWSGSRRNSTPGRLILTKYNQNLEVEKRRIVAVLKGYRDVEIVAKLVLLGTDTFFVLLSTSQLDFISDYNPKSANMRSMAGKGLLGLVLTLNLDISSDIAIIGCDPNILNAVADTDDLFLCGHTQPESADTKVPDVVACSGDKYNLITSQKGAFVANFRVSKVESIPTLTYTWGCLFGKYTDSAVLERSKKTVLTLQSQQKTELQRASGLEDKLKILYNQQRDIPAVAGLTLSADTADSYADSNALVLDMAVGSTVSGRLWVLGQYQKSVQTLESALVTESDNVRSWLCLIGADGVQRGLWDLSSSSSKESTIMAESIVVRESGLLIAGRADGVVVLDQPYALTKPLPDMVLPGDQRGGFIASLPFPTSDFSEELQLKYNWSLTTDLVFYPRLTLRGASIQLSGLYWEGLELRKDTSTLQLKGTGNLNRFLIELTENGEIYRNVVLNGVEVQKNTAIASSADNSVILATIKPFINTIAKLMIV